MKKLILRGWMVDRDKPRMITVRFTLPNVPVPKDELRALIGIEPCTVCMSSDGKGKRTTCWQTEVVSDAIEMEEPLLEVLKRIEPRSNYIIELCKEYDIEPIIKVIIKASYEESPIMEITPKVYPIISQMNIRFELDYDYWW